MNSKSAIVTRFLGRSLTTIAFVWAVQAEQHVTLTWDAPAGETNIGGYYLYYGTESGKYTNVISLSANLTRTTITGLVDDVTYFFVVTAHRSGLESNPSNETNFTAPTILEVSDRVTKENTPITVPFTIGDTQTPALLLNVTGESSDQGLVPNSNLFLGGWGPNRTVTIVPSPDRSGTTTIALTVKDGSTTASTSFLLTVDSVNAPPTLDPLDDVALLAVAGLRRVPLTGISSGAPNEAQTLEVTATTDSGLISSPVVEYSSPSRDGSISFGPLSAATGTATITVTVKADGGQTAADIFSRHFLVYVRSPASAPPTISTISDQVTDEDTPTDHIAFNIGDDHTPANLLTVATRSSNTNLVPNGNILVGGVGSSRTVTVVPALNQSGTSRITLSVTDQSFGLAASSFDLTVRPLDDAPVGSYVPDQVITEDSGTVGAISFTLDDAETPGRVGISKVLVATLATDGCSTNAVVPEANIVYGGSGRDWALTFHPAADESGMARISMIATNAKGNMSTNSFLVQVDPVNDWPTLDPVSDIIIGDDIGSAVVRFLNVTAGAATECQTLVVTAVSSDPSLIPDPHVDYTSPNREGALYVVPQRDRYGSAVIAVTVDDGAGSNNLVTQEFTVEVVHVNRPPSIFAIPPQTVNEEGSTGIIHFMISDLETPAENLTVFAFSSNPELIDTRSISFGGSGANRTIVMKPSKDQFGMATISVIVSDPELRSGITSFGLTVNPVNDPPSLEAISDITVYEGGGSKTLGLTGIGPGAIREEQILAVFAGADNSGLIADISVNYTNPNPTGTLVITPVARATGSARMAITVQDDGGTVAGGQDKSTRSFLFTILPRPTLTIERNAGGVAISWPSSAIGFELEGTGIVPSGIWNTVAAVPVVVGGRNRVTLGAAGSPRYFRLRKGLAPPQLSIRLSGDKIVLSWPDFLVGYEVEARDDFLSTTWEPLMVSPVLAGDQNTVTLEVAERSRFFRLRSADGP